MFRRIKLAWHVLRGRPLAYRVEFVGRGGVVNQLKNGKIVECAFIAGPSSPEVIAAGEAGLWISHNSAGTEFEDLKIQKLPPPKPGDTILTQEWHYSESTPDNEEDKNDQRN